MVWNCLVKDFTEIPSFKCGMQNRVLSDRRKSIVYIKFSSNLVQVCPLYQHLGLMQNDEIIISLYD